MSVEQLGDRVRLKAPLSKINTNHFGVMHAGVLFTLCEATAGVAATQDRRMADKTLIATDITIKYLHAARTAVIAEAGLSREQLDELCAQLERDPKHATEVEVIAQDENGVTVSRAVCTFQFRGGATPPSPRP